MPATLCSPATTNDVEVRSREGLMAALQLTDTEGWDGPAGAAILRHAMTDVVAPTVRSTLTRNSGIGFAEATGWATAWETLTDPGIRTVASPWGVVRAAVRWAVAGEELADRYGTDPATAWQIRRSLLARTEGKRSDRYGWARVADASALALPLSLTTLVESGYEPPAAASAVDAGGRLQLLADALACYGWPAPLAWSMVLHVAENAKASPAGTAPRSHGCRGMATDLSIPVWQAWRVTVLIVGAEGWPGLAERLERGGPDALVGPAIEVAVRSTLDRSLSPPDRSAPDPSARPPIALAS